jgi:hypothetical protein
MTVHLLVFSWVKVMIKELWSFSLRLTWVSSFSQSKSFCLCRAVSVSSPSLALISLAHWVLLHSSLESSMLWLHISSLSDLFNYLKYFCRFLLPPRYKPFWKTLSMYSICVCLECGCVTMYICLFQVLALLLQYTVQYMYVCCTLVVVCFDRCVHGIL